MSKGQQRANLLHTGTPTAPKPALPHPAHTDANCLLRHQQLGAQLLPNCPPTQSSTPAGSPRRGGVGVLLPPPPPTATQSRMANSLRSPSTLMSHQYQDKSRRHRAGKAREC